MARPQRQAQPLLGPKISPGRGSVGFLKTNNVKGKFAKVVKKSTAGLLSGDAAAVQSSNLNRWNSHGKKIRRKTPIRQRRRREV
jgi:hypothetical protein